MNSCGPQGQSLRTAPDNRDIDAGGIKDEGRNLWSPLAYHDSIRLLKLSRDTATGILQLELSEHRSNEMPSYVAISYLWGDPKNVGIIENKRGHYPLRRNLFALLNTLETRMTRGEMEKDTYLWVDALCINQDSREEKERQVQRIGETFQEAKQVLVWLGTHQKSGPSCLQILMGEKVPRLPGTRIDTHSYWTRVWIVQEFTLAKEIVLFDHSYWISGQKLVDSVPRNIEETDADDSDINAHFTSSMVHIVSSRRAVKLFSMPTRDSILQLVTSCGELECTDPRDKLYALLALYTGDISFKVDYGISVACLFWRVAVLEQFERSWFDYFDFLSALRLRLCHLLPASLKQQHIWHDPHREDGRYHVTDEEWKEDPVLKSQDSVRVRYECNPITPALLPVLNSYVHSTRADGAKSQSNDIPGFRILCGEVREKDLLIRSVGAQFALVLSDWDIHSDGTFTVLVGAIMAPPSWEGAVSEVDLSSPALMHLLSCQFRAEIREDENTLLIDMKRIDFVSMLILDSDLKDARSSCYTMIHGH